MIALVNAVLLVGSFQAADTTVEVRRGERVVIEQVVGELSISGWDRDAVEVRTAAGEPAVSVRRSGADVNIVDAEARGRRRSTNASLQVPRWIDLEIGSRSLDVSVTGISGAVRVGNLSGQVRIQDVDGPVDVRSVRGEIMITDARAPVRASSQSDDVTLLRISGPLEAHSGDGDVVLRDIDAQTVRVEAQDGDVVFSGSIAPGGDYAFFVHDGDATIALPATASARVSVSTFDGEFESDFTVRVERFSSGREFDFTLGDGDARIQIEVFDGEIRLLQR
jgi:DUF4097 and DUF4098 domain-containing protein YvlB